LKPPSQQLATPLKATHSHFSRSPKAGAAREEDTLERLAAKIAANILVITLPRSLEEYQLESTTDYSKAKKKFDNLCEQLLLKDSQCMSARFVDSNGKTVFVYLGRRIKLAAPPVSAIS
jgi:hypothetical protein